MLDAYYGKEPFDLRLAVLRLLRNLNKILLWTVVGTLLFGGGYYVKNVLLGPAPEYEAVSTYKIQYVKEPTQSGDYYINEATWNSLVHTGEFLEAVQANLATAATESTETEDNKEAAKLAGTITVDELSTAITAKLPSDWHVPTTTVVSENPEKSVMIARAVEAAMETEFLEMMGSEVASVKTLDPVTTAREVLPDVRPFRAFVLSAVLSFFFVMVGFLLKETGDDSIWLPATIRRRYGLPVLGTIESPELAENVKYLLKEKQRIAVCSVNDKLNPAEVADAITAKLQEQESGNGKAYEKAVVFPVPAPTLCPEVCEQLRETDGVLLAVKAGAHAGKQLEYVKEFLEQQDCEIIAVILWDADEAFIRAYYFGNRAREKS